MSREVPYARVSLASLAASEPNSFVDGPFGSNLTSDEYTTSGIRLIQLQNIGVGSWLDDNKRFISPRKFASLARHGAVPGDIAIAKMAEPVARACLLPDVASQFVVVADCIKLRPDRTKCDPRFLTYILNSADFRRSAELVSTGSTRVRINLGTLKKLTVLLPSKDQQRRIAEILDAVDDAIRCTQTMVGKLDTIQQGLAHDLLTLGIGTDGGVRNQTTRPEEFASSRLGAIPIDWRIASLHDVSDKPPGSTTIGPFGSNLVASDYRPAGVPVIFVRDVRVDGFRWISDIYVSESKASQLSPHFSRPGDVLATKMGLPPCIAAVHPDECEPAIITADIIRLRPDREAVDAAWLAAVINSEVVRKQVRAITGGVTRPKVTLRDFRKLLIAVPPLAEQHAIRDVLALVEVARQTHLMLLTKLRLLKNGLMHDLLEGGIQANVEDGNAR